MKYQIYLNKLVSQCIEIAAKQEGIKTNTRIKNFLENIVMQTIGTLEQTGFKEDIDKIRKGV